MRRHSVHFRYDTGNAEDLDPSFSDFLLDVPCNITERGGLEKYRGRQLQSETTHIIDTRYYEGVKPNMIAVNAVTSETYNIVRVTDPDHRKRFVVIEATEVVV